MKRILVLIFSILIVFMMLPSAAAETLETKEYENFTYQVTEADEVSILHCDKSVSGEITVPEAIDGYPVTAIGPQAFESCRGLTAATLPSSLRYIGFLAFWECSSLKKIELPDCPVSIEGNMLSDTAYFKDASNWEKGALYVGNHLIRTNASASENFKVKDSTVTIASTAFKDSKNIKKITIPDSVKVIGNDALNATAFYTNKANWKNSALYAGKHLIEVKDSAKGNFKIKDGTLTIADDAFDFCKNIKSIEIPDSVTEISRKAFRYCTALSSVTIPQSVTDISEYAFESCTGLKEANYNGLITDFEEVKIHNGNSVLSDATINTKAIEYKKDASGKILNFVYEVENDAVTVTYCDPKIVGTVTIPDTLENKPVTKIAEDAFKDCVIVNEIVLPSSIETIEKSAFENCGITQIIIPEKVTVIDEKVFSGCVALETIEIHSGLKKINENAFYGCAGLSEILYKGEEAAWNSIEIDESNTAIKSATITFNATSLAGLELQSLILPGAVGGGLALIIVINVIIIRAVKKKKNR